MKIGILTLPLNTNYGGILQAYALQRVLKQMGHEVTLIDKSPKFHLSILILTKRLIKKFILGRKGIMLFQEKRHRQLYPIISEQTQQFINQHITPRIDILDLNELNNCFDAIVVGSDQIWRPFYYPKIENAFLSFAYNWNIKRIAYAASFGTDEWEYTQKQTRRCSLLLQKFDAVSVRESSAIKLCKEYLGKGAEHVLDPTMLLSIDNYIQLFQTRKSPNSKGDMLNYILDESEDKNKLINKIAVDKKLIPFRVNSKNSFSISIEEQIAPPVEQWLRGFYDAKFVVTDSFHACAFSILFNKPFIVYGNSERGMARFNSLLLLFGLQDRIVSSFEDYKQKEYKDIDWKCINKILIKHQEKSLTFLANSLKNKVKESTI